MKKAKKSFTIIELIVSIMIFGLILIFLYSALNNLQISNEFYKHKKTDFDEKEKLTTLLYRDISGAKTLNILNPTDREHSRFLIGNTINSLYGPSNTNVMWFVHSTDNTLVRIESFGALKPDGVFLGDEKINIDIIASKCEIFKIVKQSNGTIIFLKFEGKEPVSYFINQN